MRNVDVDDFHDVWRVQVLQSLKSKDKKGLTPIKPDPQQTCRVSSAPLLRLPVDCC